MNNYKQLIVWQKSVLVAEIVPLCDEIQKMIYTLIKKYSQI